jgi:hypothetical protein
MFFAVLYRFLSSINERESKEEGITALAEGLERPALASLA